MPFHDIVHHTFLPHPSTLVLDSDFAALEPFVLSLPERMKRGEGTCIHHGRNELRILKAGQTDVVVKAFGRANIVNRYVYGTLRPSKAKRAFFNARKLLALGISTPRPVAYYNVRSTLGLSLEQSYFVTLVSPCTHRYEDLFTHHFDYAADVLRAIGRLTARLHENGLAHKDYGRANILFDRHPDGTIALDLVDLNRMAVGQLDIKAGCRNFERLPATPEMHRLMAEAYAEARGFDPEECFNLMQAYRATQPGKIDDKY